MGIPMYGIGANLLSSKTIGQVWTPKSQRLVVGRDVSPISATAFGEQSRSMVVADGDDVRFTSTDLYALAKTVAKSGQRVEDFRSVATKDLIYSNDPRLEVRNADGTTYRIAHTDVAENRALVSKGDTIAEWGDKLVTFSNNTLQVWQKGKGDEDNLISQHVVTSDTRLSWDKGNNPVITSGSQALTDGTLKARESGDILIRKSGVDVEAGDNTTVINLSDKAGKFSGGNSVIYLGAYTGGEIISGSGMTNFAGYFENAAITASGGRGVFSGVFENTAIEAGSGSDSFSGYFSGATVSAGDGRNYFGGMFLNGSSVSGGENEDIFHGRLIDSLLDAGEGANIIGDYVNLNAKKRVVTREGKEYQGIESDFIGSEIKAGSGNDTFRGVTWGGSIDLGDGDNASSGIFSEATVRGGKGNDTLTALYSNLSSFDAGDGNDTVKLATAFSSTVRTGEGTTSVTLGRNLGEPGGKNEKDFGGDDTTGSTWQTGQELLSRVAPKTFGELGGNSVDASVGDNLVTVNDGYNARSVHAADRDASGEDEKKNAKDTDDAAAKDGTALGQAMQAAEDELSLVNGTAVSREAALEEETAPERKKRRTAAERYARQIGESGVEHGSTGATIKTGAGDDIAIKTYDSMNDRDQRQEGMFLRVTRRNTGFGYYMWEKGLAKIDEPAMNEPSRFVPV